MFKEVSRTNADATMLDLEAKGQGFEQPGTDTVRFNSSSERAEHIKLIHGGWRNYYLKLNDKRRMSEIRRLDKIGK
jgi:hypothetical protein